MKPAVLLGVDAIAGEEATVTALRDLGPDTVILTAGKHGAIVGTSSGVTRFPPPAVEVIDTTGAGDTFCGAFAADLASGSAIEDAVAYGVLASALSVTRQGAQSSIPTRSEVERTSTA